MTRRRTRTIAVLGATGLVLALGGLLVWQIQDGGQIAEPAFLAPPRCALRPEPGRPPEPRPFSVDELPTSGGWVPHFPPYMPIKPSFDLDLLAPLGTGSTNAACWFKDFAEQFARHAAEGKPAYEARMIEMPIGGGLVSKVFAADDPLLLEAEPWIDQTVMRFQPDFGEVGPAFDPYPLDPVMIQDLGMSYVARGLSAKEPALAREDFRRSIRLGRLLLENRTDLPQAMAGWVCINLGTRALFETARAEGDAQTMLAASLALADNQALLMGFKLFFKILHGIFPHVIRIFGHPFATVHDEEFRAMAELAEQDLSRSDQIEALTTLRVVRLVGTSQQRVKVEEILHRQAASPDLLVAAFARQALTNDPMLERAQYLRLLP